MIPSIFRQQLTRNREFVVARLASTIPPGVVGKNKRVLPAHMYKPRPRWETGEIDME